MALIDLAITVKGTEYKSAPFTKCLETLGWTKGEGMMNALEFFTVMSNNACYCPTLSINPADDLEMFWENGNFSLLITLGGTRDEISYLLTEEGSRHPPVDINYEHAQTLVEYWAAFLAQGDPPKEETVNGKRSGDAL